MTSSPPPPPPPPTPPPPAPRPKRVKGLVCASCAGTVEVEEGLTTVVCRYCGTGQVVVGRRGTRRMMVLDRISRDAATQAIMKWFRKGVRKEPALKREIQIEESFLAWFPYIRARCDVIGWVLGVDERREKRGNKWVTVKTPVERQVSQTIDRTLAGADMSEFGVKKVHLADDEILPLNEDLLRAKGMVFRPNRAEEETAAAVFHQSLEAIKNTTKPDKVSFSWYASMRQKTDLVFYPLWVFRYSFRQRTYQVLIDAEDGSIAYGKAPGNHLWRAFSLVGSCAVATFLGTSLLQHLGGLLRSGGGLAALGVVGLLLAAIVGWGFRQFRSGGVVEEGTGLAPDPQTFTLDNIQSITDGWN